jgi:hypothetical protein
MRTPLLAALLGFLIANSATGQCSCPASTATTNPAVTVAGPPAWSAGGTITDPGTLDGICPREGCGEARNCWNPLIVNIWVTFPYNPPPAPPLPLPTANIVIGHASFGVSWGSVSNNGNGTATLSSSFPAVLNPECKTGGATAGATFELEWIAPGGGTTVRSGSATVQCKGCG